MKHSYYYLQSESGYTVVTQIARGGSRAQCVSDYGHKNLVKPYLFTSADDAIATINKSEGLTYTIRDGDGKKHDCHIMWQIKKVEIEI